MHGGMPHSSVRSGCWRYYFTISAAAGLREASAVTSSSRARPSISFASCVNMRVARTLVDEGEIPRSRVQEITGKGATVSAEIIKMGLKEGCFETPSPKGPLRVAFPAKVHEFYFPQLFLDLPVEPTVERAA